MSAFVNKGLSGEVFFLVQILFFFFFLFCFVLSFEMKIPICLKQIVFYSD